jgi:RNA polymerase sigma-70 factor (ECF subfamily)
MGCVTVGQAVLLANMRERLDKIINERDAGAFKSLFLTFGPKVRAMLMRQGADSETAEDIVQETMLTVWTKSHLFADDKGPLSGWIYAIARNLRIDRIRRQVVWDRMRSDIAAVQTVNAAANASIWCAQDRLNVANALSGLPNEQLQIVKLSLIDGLTQTEIADKLDVPLGTVKSRMRLAFDKLRDTAESAA